MIVCEILSCKLVTAVLTCVVVSGVDVSAAELDHLLVPGRVALLSDHSGELHGHRWTMYSLTVIDHSFTLAKHKANDCILPRDHTLRQKPRIEYEYAGHFREP